MKNVYICCCDKMGGIEHYSFEDGKLSLLGFYPVEYPMYAVVNKDTLHVILRGGFGKNGSACTYKIASDGSLYDKSEPITTHGIVPCHNCVADENEYVVNYLSASVVRLPDKVVTHTGRGVHPTRQEAAHTHFVTSAPDGSILCTDLGLDKIFVYDKELCCKGFTKLHAGAGPRHLAFSEDKKTLFCANELEPSVSVLDYNHGNMQVKNTYRLPQGTAAAIRVYDNSVYTSVRDSDCIVRFEITQYGLVERERTDVRGQSPRDFDIVDGHIICTNEKSNNISVFELKDKTPYYKYSLLTKNCPLCVTQY